MDLASIEANIPQLMVVVALKHFDCCFSVPMIEQQLRQPRDAGDKGSEKIGANGQPQQGDGNHLSLSTQHRTEKELSSVQFGLYFAYWSDTNLRTIETLGS